MYSSYHPHLSGLGSAGHRATSSYNYLPQFAPQQSLSPGYYLFAGHDRSRSVHGYSSLRGMPVPAPMPMPVSVPVPSNHVVNPSFSHLSALLQPAPVFAPPPAPVAREDTHNSSGGINPVLEYSLQLMSPFLCWCAFGMLKQTRQPSPAFAKLVLSVLFATRLPKSTIVVALEYMNQRFSSKPDYMFSTPMSEARIFEHLLVALILANKFNDDNTFTNKSWSGATGLALTQINALEKEWLIDVRWRLSVVPFESNILTLDECWKTWQERRKSRGEEHMLNLPAVSACNSPQNTYDHVAAAAAAAAAAYDYSNGASYPSSPAYDNYYYPNEWLPQTPIYGHGHSSRWSLTTPKDYLQGPPPLWAQPGTPQYYLPPPPPNQVFLPMPFYNQATC